MRRYQSMSLADCLDLTDDQVEMLMAQPPRPGEREGVLTFASMAEAEAYKASLGR